LPQCAASVGEHAMQAPFEQYFPLPHCESAVQTHRPDSQTGIDAAHTAQPAPEDALPQWRASVAEQERHRPEAQYRPAPHCESAVQTHAPAAQTGASPEQTAQPAGDEASPQRAASVAEHAWQTP